MEVHDGHRAFYGPRHCGLRHNDQRRRTYVLGFGTGNNSSHALRHWAPIQRVALTVLPAKKKNMSIDRGLNEWNLLREQFLSLVREGSNNIEDIFDNEFRRRFAELINQTAQVNSTSAYNWPRRLSAGNVHANRSRRAVR